MVSAILQFQGPLSAGAKLVLVGDPIAKAAMVQGQTVILVLGCELVRTRTHFTTSFTSPRH